MSKGSLFIVSAPSGAGKTTLGKMAVDNIDNLSFSVSYTTREAREGEVEGVHYHFVTKEVFNEMQDKGDFLEWAKVHDNYYGTSKGDIDKLLAQGKDVIFDIDVQGARQLKEKLNNGIYIFILPPSKEACRERLMSRAQDSDEVIEKRLATSLEEIKEVEMYDYVVINDDLNIAFELFKGILTGKDMAQEAKTERNIDKIKKLYKI